MRDEPGSIEGVIFRPLRRIPDERGTIMHGVRSDDMLSPFGEVYFKKLYAGVVNGWHIHEDLTLNYICVLGMLKIVLFDARDGSDTEGVLQEYFIGEDRYGLLHIPPGIANASKGMGHPYSIMVNVASKPHDPNTKYRRIDPHSGEIPYDWARRDS